MENKELKKELELQKRKATEYLNIAGTIILALDKKGIITLLNKKGHKILGYKQGELIGKSWFETALPKNVRKRVKRLFNKCIQGDLELAAYHENPILTKDKKTRIINWHNTLLKDDKGNITGILTSGHDITKREKAEKALIESEERYRTLVEDTPAMICRFAPDGTLLFVNQAHCDYFNMKKDELIGENFFTFIPESERKKVKKAYLSLTKKKPVETHEEKVISKNGKVEWHRWTNRIIFDKKGQFLEYQAVGLDITKQKKTQKKLLKLQQELKYHTKKLESKVKRLEKESINLTYKEKLVLNGLAANPNATDKSISEKTGIKRSTVTAIKNRLKKQEIIKTINIPSLRSIGCELLTFIYGKFKKDFKDRKEFTLRFKHEGMIFARSTDTEFISLFATKNLVEAYNLTNDFIETVTINQLIEKTPHVIYFPLAISTTNIPFDYSSFLCDIFEIENNTKRKFLYFNYPPEEIKKNTKEILYSIVKYPSLNTQELAKRLRLTRPTVKNNINSLQKRKQVHRTTIIDLKKLKCEMIEFSHLVFNPEIPQEIRNKTLTKIGALPSAIQIMTNKKDVTIIRAFKNFREDQNSIKNIPFRYNKKNIFKDQINILKMPIQKIRFSLIDFSKITKRMLEIKEEV